MPNDSKRAIFKANTCLSIFNISLDFQTKSADNVTAYNEIVSKKHTSCQHHAYWFADNVIRHYIVLHKWSDNPCEQRNGHKIYNCIRIMNISVKTIYYSYQSFMRHIAYQLATLLFWKRHAHVDNITRVEISMVSTNLIIWFKYVRFSSCWESIRTNNNFQIRN